MYTRYLPRIARINNRIKSVACKAARSHRRVRLAYSLRLAVSEELISRGSHCEQPTAAIRFQTDGTNSEDKCSLTA